MPLAPDPPFPKSQGDALRSKDWNDAVNEIIRLDNAKVNRSGDRITGALRVDGKLAVGVAAADTALHVVGGHWNLSAEEGDVKIGDATFRCKVGVALGGGGAGDVRIRAQGGTNRLMLGSGTGDVLTIQNGRVGINTADPANALDLRGGLSISGAISSPMFRVSQVFTERNGGLPLSASFTTGGGIIIIFASGSGFMAGGGGQMGMGIFIDGTSFGRVMCFTNEQQSHKSFVPNPLTVATLAAGSHTLELRANAGTFTDANDFFSATILEVPLLQPFIPPIIISPPGGVVVR